VWSPWSNDLQTSATQVKPLQTYGNITIFQADMPCVACGEKGCNNNGVVSECLKNISPHFIFKEIKEWLLSYSL
jgi:heptosyltransferase-3